MTADDLLFKSTQSTALWGLPVTASIQYDTTGDIGLLHQYAELKTALCNNLWGLDSIEYNPLTPPAIAHQRRQCLGGVQIIISAAQEFTKLPCERHGFSLQQRLPELNLNHVIYAEIADFAVLPEYQESEIVVELFHRIVKSAMDAGVQYLFMVSTVPQANRYSETAQLSGLQCRILNDDTLPDYDALAGGRACLTMLDLTMVEIMPQS